MISRKYWLLALLIAISIEVLALSMTLKADAEGAKDQGENGIEVNLGMLGDLGEANESVEEAAPEPVVEEMDEPEPVIEKETPIEVKEPEVDVKPIQEKPIKQVVEEKQKSDIKVKKTKPEPPQSTQTKAVIPEPAVKPISKPVAVAQAEAKNRDKQQNKASQKQTTGKKNALSTGGNPAATQSYFSQLATALAKHKRYPKSSRRAGEEGIVKLYFVIDRTGKVLDFRIAKSSGYKKLDDAVLDMLRKAKPLPAFPEDMVMPQLEVNVPIAFQLNTS